MKNRILITGCEGLVGRALRKNLEGRGVHIVGLDLLGKRQEAGDVRDANSVRSAMKGCRGVVHLAAVSRVITGERDPKRCWSTNVGGLDNVVAAASEQATTPWLIFASSREVYGQPEALPATEDAPLRPVNIYGRSKVEGERIVTTARDKGLRAAIVRLSNVYGCIHDHADRVVPAFAKAAVLGKTLRVDGSDHTFDFTHIDDTVRGIVSLIELLSGHDEVPPPIHFLTGRGTTLGQLAGLAIELAGGHASIAEAPPRAFDVSHFCGSPLRAARLLHWNPSVPLRVGLGRLIEAYRAEVNSVEQRRVAR